ncbi:conserved hypothetical protein [Gluconacetobacter diazotrophicus PA1 5]|uniref:Uncharacterized protein n=1 Tax=Gluconacetobacter diazotrophicus (strain ATCC 49037 / DSM 5601 / CCUG 37298 / CIP 103539 / LMG 7603 / PAl5) TaxID=272568 RepID=A9H088_GLUDA|nr:conserved hypothetical protein [Gluconacetobacter diazotrophicus PA1 5]
MLHGPGGPCKRGICVDAEYSARPRRPGPYGPPRRPGPYWGPFPALRSMNVTLFRPALHSPLARAMLLAMLPGAGLLAVAPARAADDAARDPIGIWTGTLVADRGVCPETNAPSTLQVGTKRIAFTPGDGALVLHGTRDATPGRFHAQLVLSDMNRKPYPLVFEGKPDGSAISGTYGTPRCRAHVTLTRPKSNGMAHFLGH